MTENKTFHIAFLVSVLIHSIFFLGLPRMSFFPSRRSLENLKITYYKVREIPEDKKISSKESEPIVKELPEIKKEEILRPPGALTKETEDTETQPKRVTAFKPAKQKKFETMLEEEQSDAKKATYISYYRAVREKIRQHADENYPKNRNLGEGEVFLSFVVASNGELLRVRVINEKSTNDISLRNIAIGSVRDASPFPPFPRGMSQYQITFNVIILFELNK